jgi:hypothetical protein
VPAPRFTDDIHGVLRFGRFHCTLSFASIFKLCAL